MLLFIYNKFVPLAGQHKICGGENEMVFCGYCGQSMGEEAKSCWACGTPRSDHDTDQQPKLCLAKQSVQAVKRALTARNKKVIAIIAVALVAVIGVVAIASNSISPQKLIVGDWATLNGRTPFVSFYKDGTVTYHTFLKSGTYKIQDRNSLSLQLPSAYQSAIYQWGEEWSVSKDNLWYGGTELKRLK
jgi:hypothetical protein